MDRIGRKLRKIRVQLRLSLRQVERLTAELAKQHRDPSLRVSASWIGRFEREEHDFSHNKLKSLEEVYGITHEDLLSEAIPFDKILRKLLQDFPDVPQAVLNWLSGHNGPLLPPNSWLAYFPDTTLLPVRLSTNGNGRHTGENTPLVGILGANDYTLVPTARPGALLVIDGSVRSIRQPRAFRSVFERPIYFLHSRDGYHCGWCDLDENEQWLTLVPSTMTTGKRLQWRYRKDVEVIGLVTHTYTRLGGVDILLEEENGSNSRKPRARRKDSHKD